MKTFYLLPNFITTGNLFCGFLSIYFSAQNRILYAIYMVFIAIILDFLDGETARCTNNISNFGMQLDSLTDIVSFGIAPIVIFLQAYNSNIAIFGFIYIVAGVLRLARYNIQQEKEEKAFFTGMPITAAAGLLVSFILLCLIFDEIFFIKVLPLFIIFISFLMVSSIKYPVFHKISLFKKISMFVVLIGCILSIIFDYPYFIFLCFFIYALSGLFLEIKLRLFQNLTLNLFRKA